jgi:hypothetical protein
MNQRNTIYDIAKKGNKEQLKAYINIHQALIDEGVPFTAAAKLASEGNFKAAELLRSLGASIHYIAFGAAQGGYRDYAEWFRTKHHADVNAIARGAALGGHGDYAEWLLLWVVMEITPNGCESIIMPI